MRYVVKPRGAGGKPMHGGHPRRDKEPTGGLLSPSCDASRCRPDHGLQRAVVSVYTELPPMPARQVISRPSAKRSERVERQGGGKGIRIYVPA